MNPENLQQTTNGSEVAVLSSQAQNTSNISAALSSSTTLVDSPSPHVPPANLSPRPFASPSPLVLPPPLMPLPSPGYFSARPTRAEPIGDIHAVLLRRTERATAQALWPEHIATLQTAAATKIWAAWDRYDLDKPLPGNRAGGPEKKLKFRYGFKTD